MTSGLLLFLTILLSRRECPFVALSFVVVLISFP
jgi:hypothetical protein